MIMTVRASTVSLRTGRHCDALGEGSVLLSRAVGNVGINGISAQE